MNVGYRIQQLAIQSMLLMPSPFHQGWKQRCEPLQASESTYRPGKGMVLRHYTRQYVQSAITLQLPFHIHNNFTESPTNKQNLANNSMKNAHISPKSGSNRSC